MRSDTPNSLLKISETCQLLRLDRCTVRKLVSEGRLRAYRFGAKSFRFRPSDVQEFIAASVVKASS